jgi:plastocyanin
MRIEVAAIALSAGDRRDRSRKCDIHRCGTETGLQGCWNHIVRRMQVARCEFDWSWKVALRGGALRAWNSPTVKRSGFALKEVARTTGLLLVIVIAACSGKPTGIAQPTAPTGDSGTITVRLSSFAFDPEEMRLEAGAPVRLRIVNDSDAGHNFSAPAFFAASSLLAGSSVPLNGAVEVEPHQTVEIALVPGSPATYPLECTHFLHSLFGMHGTIAVMR